MAEQTGEKTEKPTNKRLRDARKKGQVAKSQDLSAAVLLLGAVTIIWLMSGLWGAWLMEATKSQITFAATFKGDFTKDVAMGALWEGLKIFLLLVGPLLGVMFIVAFAVNYLQVGSIFSVEPVTPKFSKLNPAEGFKQKFLKMRSYVELLKTVIKLIIVSVVVGWVLWDAQTDLVRLIAQPLEAAITFAFYLLFSILMKVGIAFLLIGGADFFLQYFLHRKELMMTKQEIREEYKETEGNPYIKARRRFLHREIIMQAMAAAVKKADVVVANPTHVAVALSYDKEKMNAPTIVAKGADLMAARIREIAAENNVPIKRDIPLARALYEFEVEDEIPDELYEAVAVVLSWVYEIKDKQQ
jgi:flagellar biosynthetic protein FlhB